MLEEMGRLVARIMGLDLGKQRRGRDGRWATGKEEGVSGKKGREVEVEEGR